MAKQRTKKRTPGLEDFLATLERSDVQPVYAVLGDEELTKAEAIAAIKAKAVGSGDPSMCYVELDPAETTASAVFDELRTVPFLGSRRVVLIEGADGFIDTHKEALNSYLGHPSATGTLILTLKKLDARTKLGKTLSKWHSVVECRRLYANQLPDWITARVHALGKHIDHRAVQFLAESVGPDLAMLSTHIEKVVTYVGDRPQITTEDVAALTDPDRTRTVFELTDCMTRKDAAKALTVLGQFLHTDGQAPYIVTMLTWQLRRLWKTKLILAQHAERRAGDPTDEIHRAVGGHPFFVKDLILQARACTEADLERGYRLLLDCDIALKSTGDSPKLLLEMLVLNLCR